MFTALHGLARRATLHIIVAAEGEQLRVTVQPKPNGSDAPIPPALSLLASPEEFDRNFAATVAQYETPATSLLDQGKAAAAAVEKTAEQSADKKSTKKAPDSKSKPITKTKPAGKAVSNAGSTKPAEKTASTKAEKKDKPPKPAPTNDSSVSAADRDALIALAKEYISVLMTGEKPTRAGFIKRHKAGRRYERIFGTIEELFAAAQPIMMDGKPAATGGTVDAGMAAPAGAGANETILSAAQVEAYMKDPDSADEKTREAMVGESTEAEDLLRTSHITNPSKTAETVDGSGSPAAAQNASAEHEPGTPALSLI